MYVQYFSKNPKYKSKSHFTGIKGTVFCLDGAPDFLYAILTMTISFKNDFQLQNSLLCHTVDIVAPNNDATKDLMEKLNDIESFDDRIECAINTCPVDGKYSKTFIANTANATYDRLKVVLNFNNKQIKKVTSPIILIRPKENPPYVVIEENYGLDKYSDHVTIHFLEGNHVTIIENKDSSNIINKALNEGGEQGKINENVITSIVENQREVSV